MTAHSESFLQQIHSYLSDDDYHFVLRSLAFAGDVHDGFVRLTGEPYINHAIAVAQILAEWRAPADVLAAALLHDANKSTYARAPSSQEMRAVIGDRATLIVNQISRLGRFGPAYHKNSQQADGNSVNENRTLSWAAIVLRQEPTAVIIKIADRIDNFRSLQVLPRNRRRAFAHGVRNIFIPFAQSLGMRRAKRLLEDGAFQVLDPVVYQRITKLYQRYHEKHCNESITSTITALQNHLAENGLNAAIQCAPTSRCDLHKRESEATSGASYLFPPILVLVDDKNACYRALGLIHQLWRPRSSTLHDYIAAPKSSGYQAIHTQVHVTSSDYILIEIQDRMMHLVAEYGVTARWQGVSTELTPAIPTIPEPPPGKIAVFTPEGEIKILPENATPVDFAYAIHPELGHQCSGAMVNGQHASLSTELKSGDLVRILTSATKIGPSLAWLDFVKSARAKREIRKWHTKRSPKAASGRGKKLLDERLRDYGVTLSTKETKAALTTIARVMNYESLDALYIAIGVGQRSIESVVNQYLHRQKGSRRTLQPSATISSLGHHNLPHRLAKCCNPRPPDPIVGYITRDNRVTIHRADCKNLRRLRPLFAAEWNTPIDHHITQVEIEAVDRPGLIRDISALILERDMIITSFHADRIDDGSARIQIVFESILTEDFMALKAKLLDIEDVRNVHAAELTMPSRVARGAIVERLFINPYTLNPATGDRFVGRTKELQELVNKLRGIRPGQAVLVWGPRRIGKTSLLLQFQNSILNHADYAVAYLNLHQLSGQSTTSFMFEILKAIAAESHPDGIYAPNYHRMKRDPLSYFNNFIQKRLPQSSKHIVLLFDEFQFIADLKEERISLQDINHYFRSLIQQRVGLTIIFSGGGVLSDLRKQADTVSLLEVAEYLPIKCLSPTEARELITEPTQRINYEESVVDRLVKLTSGHPYFLQLICGELFDYATENQITHITPVDLDLFLEQSWTLHAEHYFSHLWGDGVISNRRRLLRYKLAFVATALSARPGEWIDFGTLDRRGVTSILAEEQLWQALEGLRALDSLAFRNENEFRISIEFAQLWAQQNFSFSYLRRGL